MGFFLKNIDIIYLERDIDIIKKFLIDNNLIQETIDEFTLNTINDLDDYGAVDVLENMVDHMISRLPNDQTIILIDSEYEESIWLVTYQILNKSLS